MIRKLGFAFISVVLLPVGVDVQALSGLGVVVVSLVLQVQFAPYTDPSIDRMETLALATSFATLFLGLYLFSPNTSPWFRTLSSLAVVGVNAGFLVYVAYALRSVVKEAHALVQRRLRAFSSRDGGPAVPGVSDGRLERAVSAEVEMVVAAAPAMSTNRMFVASPKAIAAESAEPAHEPAAGFVADSSLLPEGWGITSTEDGTPYYYNTDTGVSSWTKPQ